MLDASCGTGINAAVLARRGLNVWAADGSEAMIEEAAARFVASIGDPRAALPVGGSSRHPRRTLKRRALRRELAGPRRGPGRHGGGAHRAEADGPAQSDVAIDSRNWEKLHAERRIVRVANRMVARNGRRCLSFYAWEIPDRLQDEHVAHIVLVFADGDRVETREYPISFRPFTNRRAARTTRTRRA